MHAFIKLILEDKIPRFLLDAWEKNAKPVSSAFIGLERKIKTYSEWKSAVAKRGKRSWQAFLAFLSAIVFLTLALNSKSLLLGTISAALVLTGYFLQRSRSKIEKNINRDFDSLINARGFVSDDMHKCAMDLEKLFYFLNTDGSWESRLHDEDPSVTDACSFKNHVAELIRYWNRKVSFEKEVGYLTGELEGKREDFWALVNRFDLWPDGCGMPIVKKEIFSPKGERVGQ